MIFKTFDKIVDDDGNTEQSWGFVGSVNAQERAQRLNDLETSLQKEKEIIKNYQDEYNKILRDNPDIDRDAAHRAAIQSLDDVDDAMMTHLDTYRDSADAIDEWDKKQRVAIDNAKKGFKGLSASTKAMFANIGAELAIAFAFQAAMKAFQAADKKWGLTAATRIEKMETAVNKFNEATSESKNNIKTIESLSTEYNTLAQGVDASGKNVGLTTDEFARYNEIVDELVAMNPELVKGYTAEGHAIIDRNDAIQEGIKLQQEYAKQARQSYIASGNDIIKGSKENMKDALSSMRSELNNIEKILGNKDVVTYVGDSLVEKNANKYSDVINKALGHEVDLYNASADTLADIATQRAAILKTAKESGNYDEENLDNLNDSLIELHAYSSEYEQATQPIVDWLQTYVSDASKVLSSIPESLQSGFQSGLRQIASSGGDAAAMKASARKLAESLNEIYTANENGYTTALKQYEDAQDVFMSGDKNAKAVKEYNTAIEEQASVLEELANQYEVTDAALAESLRSQAYEMRNFAKANELTIQNAVNGFEDFIDAARNAKTAYDESIAGGDYYTGVNSFKEVYDAIMTEENTAGFGSMSFWKGAEQILGSQAIRDADGNLESVKSQLKAIAPLLDSSAEATSLFGEKLLSLGDTGNLDEQGNIIDQFGNKLGEVQDTAEGIKFNIPEENIASVARLLGMSTESLVAMLDAARQFADVDFYDPAEVKKALKEFDGAIQKEVDGKEIDFINRAALKSESGLDEDQFADLEIQLKADSTQIIDAQADVKTLISQFKMLGTIDADGKINLDSTIEKMHQMQFSLDDIQFILGNMKISEDSGITGWESQLKDGESLLDHIVTKYDELNAESTTTPYDDMAVSIDNLRASIDALNETMGGTPPKVETEIDIDTTGVDEANKKLEESSSYWDDFKKRNQWWLKIFKSDSSKKSKKSKDKTSTRDDTKTQTVKTKVDDKELDKLNEKTKKYTKDKTFDIFANTEQAERNLEDIQAESAKIVDKQFKINATDNASSALNGIIGKLQSFAGKVFTAKVSVSETKGAQGKSGKGSTGKNGNKKGGSGATGTPDRRTQSYFPSMSNGGIRGQLGPKGKGGLTLTGELGTELVWDPNKGISYLVGQYGPEMVNLPGNAVVYPADETRRILGDTIPLHKYNFGSLAAGHETFGSAAVTGTIKKSTSSSSKKKTSKKKSSKKITISNYDKDLATLDHQLEMGYISEVTYYKKLQALYKKYKKALKKNTEENREALEAQKQARIDAYESEVDALDHKLEMGEISEAQYYKKLAALGDKYYKGQKGYDDEWKAHLEARKDAAIDAYDKEAEALEKQLERGEINITQYFQKINAAQNKWLSGKAFTDDLADANEDELDKIIEGLDKIWDDAEQKIEDNDLFGTWVVGGESAIDILDAAFADIEAKSKDLFENEADRIKYLTEKEREYAEAKKSAYEDQQDSLNTIIDLIEDMVRQETEDQIDALQKQKDAYSDIIDAKKESLRITEQELEYQEEMDEYATDIAKLQEEIFELGLDDSRSAQAKKAEKEAELAELMREQAKAQREETISRTEDSLDSQDELFSEIIDKAIEKLEAFLNNKSAVLNVVMDTIEQKETNNLLNRLLAYNGEHGDAMKSTVEKAMNDLNLLIGEYGSDIESIVEVLQKGIDVNVTGGIISVDQTDYAQTQAEIDNRPIGTHHSGLATGFTGDGADIKQHEVYRLLTDDELVFNRDDQMRIASQLQVLDTIKNSFDNLSRGVISQPTQNSQSIELVVNAPITIEGNASAETVSAIKEAITETTNASLDKLNEALRINGVRSRVASNLRKN